MTIHYQMTDIHRAAYIADDDPATDSAILPLLLPGIWWLDTSTGARGTLKQRAASSWDVLIDFDNVEAGGGGSAINWLGAWDSGTDYVIADAVSSAGSSYIATADNTNSEPPSADWDLLAERGTDGADGTDGTNGADGADGADGLANPMTTAADLIVGGAAGAPARLGKGSDGQVLTVDPTTHLLVWATPSGGGGGGASIYSNAIGSPPSSPADGDLWLPPDASGLSALRVSSAWRWYHAGVLVVPLDDSGWTWINQGTGARSSAHGNLLLSDKKASGSSWNGIVRKHALPATPYDIVAKIRIIPPSAGTSTFLGGITLRESSSGKMFSISVFVNLTETSILGSYWSDATSYVASDFNPAPARWIDPEMWLRITDDGTTRKYYASVTPDVWAEPAFSHLHTDRVTPDEVGIVLGVYTPSVTSALEVLSYTES